MLGDGGVPRVYYPAQCTTRVHPPCTTLPYTTTPGTPSLHYPAQSTPGLPGLLLGFPGLPWAFLGFPVRIPSEGQESEVLVRIPSEGQESEVLREARLQTARNRHFLDPREARNLSLS